MSVDAQREIPKGPVRQRVRVAGPPGQYSRGDVMVAGLDPASPEAEFLQGARRDLTAHVGGAPSCVERILIDRCARLMLFLELRDRRALKNGVMSERDSRTYLSWNNSLRLGLKELGIRGSAKLGRPLELREYLTGGAPR
jgi:hypothetical protein